MKSSSRDIQLSVRVRPATSEGGEEQPAAVTVDEHGAVCVGGGTFSFPHSVVTGSDQARAFEALAPRLLHRAREGYNCTVMAYGQTGSGKTHTMFGPPGCLTEASLAESGDATAAPAPWGIFPRIALELLQELEEETST